MNCNDTSHLLALGLQVTLIALVIGCQSADYSAMSTPQTRVQFQCVNGEAVEMRFFPQQGVGVLVRAGTTLELQQQPSGSGFIYSNGPTIVRGKGSELTLEVGGMAPVHCQAR